MFISYGWFFVVAVVVIQQQRQHKKLQKWWMNRESVLTHEIEGPFWTRHDYMGDVPNNVETQIDQHNEDLLKILGAKRFNRLRNKKEQTQ